MTPESQRRGRSKNPLPRFMAKVEAGVCMEWTSWKTDDGYGRFMDCNQPWLAHRWIWTYLYGAIPGGRTVDHLCRNPSCVDPAHLRLLSIYDNVMSGYSPEAINRRKTHCKRGHEFTSANTLTTSSGGRSCRECKRQYERDYSQGRRRARLHGAAARN